MLSEEAKPYGYLVCDECAVQHAPELFQAHIDFRWPALPYRWNEDGSFPVMWGKSIELANSVNERFPQ